MRAVVQRNFGLDLLRCLAIALVLANHALGGFFLRFGQATYDGAVAAASLVSILSIEWLFVLSGFLIGTMMIRTFEQEPTFWRRARGFWLRRWFRTLPNYYLFLGVNILLVAWGLAEGTPSWRHAVFAQNLAGPESVPYFFVEAWSLALDEWFYLVLPLLVGLFGLRSSRHPRRTFLLATATLIAVPMLLRGLAPPPDPAYFGGHEAGRLFDWDLRIRRVTVLHLDATGWGVLGALLSRWWPGFYERHAAWKAAGGIALMLAGLGLVEQLFFGGFFVAELPRWSNVAGITCMSAGTLLVLPALIRLRAPHHGRRIVEAVSNYSYSIYLAHLPVLFVIAHFLPAGWTTRAALFGVTAAWLVATLLVSAAVHHSFERPLSNLRERFTRRIDASPFGPASAP